MKHLIKHIFHLSCKTSYLRLTYVTNFYYNETCQQIVHFVLFTNVFVGKNTKFKVCLFGSYSTSNMYKIKQSRGEKS